MSFIFSTTKLLVFLCFCATNEIKKKSCQKFMPKLDWNFFISNSIEKWWTIGTLLENRAMEHLMWIRESETSKWMDCIQLTKMYWKFSVVEFEFVQCFGKLVSRENYWKGEKFRWWQGWILAVWHWGCGLVKSDVIFLLVFKRKFKKF